MPTRYGGASEDLDEAVRSDSSQLILMSALSQAGILSLDPARPYWFDFMDLWSAFGEREAKVRRGLARLTSRSQAALLRRQEIKLARGAVAVSTASWTDATRLREAGVAAEWVPTALPDDQFRNLPTTKHSSRPSLGFFGNFHFWPNTDAFAYLVQLAPVLRAAGWNLVVAGRGAASLPEAHGIVNLGEVRDPDDFYSEVHATIAPIRLGGGMKVKIVESLSRGRAVIATPFALEGFPAELQALCASVMDMQLGVPAPGDLGRVDSNDPVLNPYRKSKNQELISSIYASIRDSA